MADLPASLANIPDINAALGLGAPAPQPGNWLTAGLSSGYHEAVGQLGGFEEAAGQVLGLPSLQEYGASVAANRARLAQAAGRPDLENSWWPSGLGYKVAKMIPSAIGMIGAGALGVAAAPEALGAAAGIGAGALAGYPLMVGGNVEASKQQHGGELAEGQGARALMYGVPEAALGAVGPGMLGRTIARGAEGAFAPAFIKGELARRAFGGAVTLGPIQGVANAANTAIQQGAFGDPNMQPGDRARQIVDSFFTGALGGVTLGAAVHGIFGGKRGEQPDNQQLQTTVDTALPVAGQTASPGMPETATQGELPLPKVQTDLPMGTNEEPTIFAPNPKNAFTPTVGDRFQPGIFERPKPPVVDENGQIQADLAPSAEPYLGTNQEPSLFAPKPDEAFTPSRGATAPERAIVEGDTPLAKAETADLTAALNRAPSGMKSIIQQELDRRAPIGGGEPYTLAQMVERQPQIDALRAQAESLMHVNSRDGQTFLRNTNAATPEEMQAALGQKLDTTDKPKQLLKTKWFQALGTRFGLLDEQGRVIPPEERQAPQEPEIPAPPEAPEQVQDLAAQPQETQDALRAQVPDFNEPAEVPVSETQQTEIPSAPAVEAADTYKGRNVLYADGEKPHWQVQQEAERARTPEQIAAETARRNARSVEIERLSRNETEGVQNEEQAARQQLNAQQVRARLEAAADDMSLTREQRAAARMARMATSPTTMQETLNKLYPPEQKTSKASQVPPRNADISFADPHAFDLNGDTVYEKGDNALVRGIDQNGEVAYSAVNRRTGERTNVDVSKADTPWLSQQDRVELLRAKATAEKADQKAFEAAPDGPFRDGADLATSETVRPQHAQFVDDLMRSLGLSGIRTFLTNARDMSDPNAASKYGLNGPYRSALAAGVDPNFGSSQAFGPGAKSFVIHYDDTQSNAKTTETLAHEVGHIVYDVAYRNAAPNVRAKIDDAFNRFMAKTTGMPLQDVIKATRAKYTAEMLTRNMDPNAMGDVGQREYFRSKAEWFADQVARYANMPPEAPAPTTMLGKFFSAVANKIKSMVGFLRGDMDVTPTEAVADFLRNMPADTGQEFMRSTLSGSTRPSFEMRTEPETGTIPAQEKDNNRFAQVGARMSGALDNRLTQWVSNAASGVKDNLPGSIRGTALGWTDSSRIAMLAKSILPQATEYLQTMKDRMVRGERGNQMMRTAYDPASRLPKNERKAMDTLMAATLRGVDGLRPWTDPAHVDLHAASNAAEYQQLWREAARAADVLRTSKAAPGALDMYRRLVVANEAQHLAAAATTFHEAMRPYAGFNAEAFKQSAMDAYQYRSDLHGSPENSQIFFKDWLTKQIADASNLIGEVTGRIDPNDKASVSKGKMLRADLEGSIADAKDVLDSVGKVPNFHVGRYGDWFVSASLPKNEDGTINAAAAREVQSRLNDAGFGDYVVNSVGPSGIFLRLNNKSEAQQVHDLFTKAQSDGHLADDAIGGGSEPGNNVSLLKSAPGTIQRLIKRVENDPRYDATTRAQIVQQMTRQYLDLLPDNANAYMRQARRGVQGFSGDMLRNYAYRASVGWNAIANVSAHNANAEAMAGMVGSLKGMKRGVGNVSLDQRQFAQQVINEFQMREATRDWRSHNNFLDQVRSFTHSFFLSMSPGYALTELSQLGTHLLPQLGATYGYGKSAKALTSSMGEAMKILNATWQSEHGWDMAITRKALEDAKVNKGTIDLVMNAANRGDIDLGSMTRALGRASQGATDSGVAWLERRSNVMAAAAELYPRLVSTLAISKLHGDKATLPEAISYHTGNALQNWFSGNTARQLGNAGFAGRMTPLLAQFTSYQTQFVGKLYQEVAQALGRIGTKEEQAASRRYLAGHMMAMTAVAGTLGMPFASAIAGAADKTMNTLTGKDDYDVEGSYRNLLTDVFGANVGEVLAKGAPRALGLDMSDLGDQDLLPFTRFLTDRRKMEDALGDWAKQAMGSPFSMVVNAVLGAREFTNGNYLGGLQRMVPTAMRGPLEAFRMGQNGYENARGVKLPMTPTAQDILVRAMGLHPANKAQMAEANAQAQGLEETKNFRAQLIRERFARAMSHGDQPEATTAVNEAMAFQKDHPYDINFLPSVAQIPMKGAMETATARALHVPLGVGMRNVEARRALDWYSRLQQ